MTVVAARVMNTSPRANAEVLTQARSHALRAFLLGRASGVQLAPEGVQLAPEGVQCAGLRREPPRALQGLRKAAPRPWPGGRARRPD